jgi:putative FmdB family regulatory protein
LEVLQKINDRPLRKCAECSGKLEKLISRTSFHLKGGGWFAQGYGNAAAGNGKESSTGTGSESSASSSSGEKKKSPAKESDSSGGTKSSAASA